MGYNALLKMKERNRSEYGIDDSPCIPELPKSKRSCGSEALRFIRDCCEDLKFDIARSELSDSDGGSAGKGQIPFNMERDLDRLSFEAAIGTSLPPAQRRMPLISITAP